MKITTMLAAAALAGGLAAAPAAAQDNYPTKPVSIIIPAAAGSAADIAMRIIAEQMADVLKQQVLVVPAPGAGGMIGAEQIKRANPDGYNIGMMINSVLVTSPAIMAKPLNYDPEKDYIPIGGLNQTTSALAVSSAVPANTVQEFIDYAKKQPQPLNYASGGPGSNQHMAMEIFMSMTGTKFVDVPYQAPPAAAAALAQNTVQAHFITASAAAPHLQAKTIKILGIGAKVRNPGFAGVPTIDESGVKGFEFLPWAGLFAPKGTPEPAVVKLRAALKEALSRKMVVDQLMKAGLDPWPATAEELQKRASSELAAMKKLAAERHIRIE